MKRSFKNELRTEVLRRNLRERTFGSYWSWVKAFYRFTGLGMGQCGEREVSAFLTHLNRSNYSGSSRRQALNALVFAYRYVVGKPLGDIGPAANIRVYKAPAVVPTVSDVGRILSGMSGSPRLIAKLMYGCGLRIGEACQLRVQNIDLGNSVVCIFDAKGGKHRQSVLPVSLKKELVAQVEWRAALHKRDRLNGGGFVELPGRYKYKNRRACRDIGWQFLFPSQSVRRGFRWYFSARHVQEQFKNSVRAAGIRQRFTPHSLRKAFATHLHRDGVDVRTVQELLGHAKMETTLVYLEAASVGSVMSPLDSHPMAAN